MSCFHVYIVYLSGIQHQTFCTFITAFTITHRKYSPTGSVKDYTVHRREVAKNAFMYLHVLVGR